MIRYKSTKQLTIEEFKTPFQINLKKNNRWVRLAWLIPWDDLAAIYYSNMSADQGAPAVDARIVIGAMIIKHKQKLDDREAIEFIRENPYAQYFLGLSDYTYEDVFDRSLFTTLRYRMGTEVFDQMNVSIIARVNQAEKGRQSKEPPESSKGCTEVSKQNESRKQGHPASDEKKKNKGKLLIDATVADQMIVYPTDLGLLNRSREETERIIDNLHKLGQFDKKPRTYRRKARKEYLAIAKKRHKTKKELRKSIGKQINYVRRNLKSIHKQLDHFEGQPFPLSHRDQKIFFVIQHIYAQQLQMHKERIHSCPDRIVNIYQPYVRPIVRGKDKSSVEFGAKLGVSMQKGFARINTFSWNAYNESADLKKQAEDYKEVNGYYPETVVADTIYGSRENRTWLKEHGIRFSGKALGRPPKTPLTDYQRRKQRKEQRERNQIEGKFGQGKNGYNLNKIRARQQKTSESWVSCIFFVMNLVKFYNLACKAGKDFLFACYKRTIIGLNFGINIFSWRTMHQYQSIRVKSF